MSFFGRRGKIDTLHSTFTRCRSLVIVYFYTSTFISEWEQYFSIRHAWCGADQTAARETRLLHGTQQFIEIAPQNKYIPFCKSWLAILYFPVEIRPVYGTQQFIEIAPQSRLMSIFFLIRETANQSSTNGQALPPLPLVMAWPLVEELFCGFS